MKRQPIFLTLAEILEIQLDQITRYGGSPWVRDMGLLESAISMPYQSFGGQFLHRDLFEMAGGYAFYICGNHPFLDGNKRTALAAALVFLKMNGISVSDPKQKLYEAMLDLAQGKVRKEELSTLLRALQS